METEGKLKVLRRRRAMGMGIGQESVNTARSRSRLETAEAIPRDGVEDDKVKRRNDIRRRQAHKFTSYFAYLEAKREMKNAAVSGDREYRPPPGIAADESCNSCMIHQRKRQNIPDDELETDDPNDDKSEDTEDSDSDESADGEDTDSEDELRQNQTGSPTSLPTGSSRTITARTGFETLATSSPTSIPTSLPLSPEFKPASGLANHPAHIAVLVVGVLVGISIIAFLTACFFIRKKKRGSSDGGFYSKYLPFAQRTKGEGGIWPTTAFDREKDIKDWSSETTQTQDQWDFKSSFAKPFAKPESRNRHSRGSRRSMIRQAIHAALGSHPLRAKSTVSNDASSARTLVERDDPAQEVVQVPRASHLAANSETASLHPLESPLQTPRSQVPASAGRRGTRNPRSKFSWSTASRSATRTSLTPSTRTTQVNNTDARTEFTEDSEPPRFRTTTSWIVNQQFKKQRDPFSPKKPPVDLESLPSALPSRPPTAVFERTEAQRQLIAMMNRKPHAM
ncbi:hypothetical protein AJ80_05923 [Polytolypa hystricis UAMH7299]|uniref:Uncharacterized protein n=1 Tax=Polytolypa hystricis (strain UAMH7299) TaxID=1447883 RepID=A0A2B7Y101_POLH7|nr:hypothetical protein AJ80_05923 [Polytolypa hystricis UAMH7299]